MVPAVGLEEPRPGVPSVGRLEETALRDVVLRRPGVDGLLGVGRRADAVDRDQRRPEGLPAGDLRKPLTNLDGEALAKGIRIVKELGLDEQYGYKVAPFSAVAA